MDATLPVLLIFSMVLVAIVAVGRLRGTARLGGRRADRAHAHIEASVSWLGTYSQAFQRVLDVLELIDARLLSADPNRGTVVARTESAGAAPVLLPVTLRLVLTTQDGVTFVHVEAVSALPFLPYGARRLVDEFIRTWDRLPGPVRVQAG